MNAFEDEENIVYLAEVRKIYLVKVIVFNNKIKEIHNTQSLSI